MAVIYTYKKEAILVDDEYFGILNKFTWRIQKNGYVVSSKPEKYGRGLIYMHRIVMVPPEGMEIDHINVDKTDNRKENLRICTHEQNCANRKISSRNTTGFKGVSWDKSRGKWLSRIKHDGKQINLGRYESVEDAFRAYCLSAKKLKGEFKNYG